MSLAIEAAARAARVTATAFFVVGGLGVIAAVVITDYSRHPHAGYHFALLLLIVAGMYFVPAGLLLYLARRMERTASRGPFVAALAVACLAGSAWAFQLLRSAAAGEFGPTDLALSSCMGARGRAERSPGRPLLAAAAGAEVRAADAPPRPPRAGGGGESRAGEARFPTRGRQAPAAGAQPPPAAVTRGAPLLRRGWVLLPG